MTSTADLWNQMDEKFGETNPNTGAGWLGAWPEEGDHQCDVLYIEVNEKDKFIESGDGGKRTEHSATSYRFFFLTQDTENGELKWGGNPFVFPHDISRIYEDGALKNIEINRDRLAGHLKSILGVPVGTTDEDAIPMGKAIDDTLAICNDSDTKPVVTVRCQYREYTSKRGKKGVSRDEFILNRLA